MSNLIRVSNDLQFHLSNTTISYIFCVSPEGILEHLHFGKRINTLSNSLSSQRRVFRGSTLEFEGVENYNLSDIPQEYPTFGTSDNRFPALHVINASGNSVNVLRYTSYKIVGTKPALDSLPSARGGVNGDSETLIVTLRDDINALSVELHYTVYADHNVIARSSVVINEARSPVSILHASSTSLDLPAEKYDIFHLRGSWAREFNQVRDPLPQGHFSISSATGNSSAAHTPFLAVIERDASEFNGNVFGFSLVYSGNFAMSVEQNEFDSVRVNSGINPFNFRWKLEPGEHFTCPESLQVFSDEGLDGMSQTWHRFIDAYVIPVSFKARKRPTYLNSWEACYFDINEALTLKLADQAKTLGIEMLVIDDGWFQGRTDAKRALGDWYTDASKFPEGINETAKKVHKKGLMFGLWLEPEMVNENSELYAKHPDWVIHIPHRKPTMGRDQLILDLSKSEVVEYLYARVDAILSAGQVDYIKWDMNRIMSDIGSSGLPLDRQLEVPHRYMLGLYTLLDRLTRQYPQVLFENCASGGNRFDLGMLYYMAQGWVSDMSEPIGRLPIINGASHLYPLSVLASYICPIPSHLNGRQVSLKTQAEVGFFCAARGLSLNVEDISSNTGSLRQYMELYKKTSGDVINGTFHRLIYDNNTVCWQLISGDRQRIYVGYFHILAAVNLPYKKVNLKFLDAGGCYRLDTDPLDMTQERDGKNIYGGDTLMHIGIDLPYVCAFQSSDADYLEKGDFASRLFVLTKQ